MSIVEQLQRGCHKIELPAELEVADGGTLLVVQMLRLLPGKRAVMKAQWEGRPVLVKLMLGTVSGWRSVRRELAGYRALKSAKIMTPDVLFTTRGNSKSHVLVSEFLETAQGLGELWHKQADRRSQLSASCLSLMAQLHRKGCSHTDPHLDNFLLANNQLYVVDVGSVRKHLSAGYGKWRRKNLALFLTRFPPLWRHTVLGFLTEHYAEAKADRKLEKAIKRAWRRHKFHYLKKSFRECSEFSTHKNWHRVAVWKRTHQSDDLMSFLKNPDTWVKRGELLKDGNSATVVRTLIGGQQVAIKRNNIKGVRHWLRRCFRATRSRVNWRNMHLLKISGIATPEGIAFVEKRWGPFRFRGYYVCAYSSFPSAAEKYISQAPTSKELTWFEELFTSMRLAWLCHGDLKASNLLITDKGIELIDLDSIKECSSKNALQRMLFKDQRRFLKNWEDRPELLRSFSGVFDKA